MTTYLTVDEQSTYIDVVCDGYVIRIYSNTTGLGNLYNATGATQYGWFESILVSGSSTYNIYTDTSRDVILVENTPTRVIIKSIGNYCVSGTPHSNIDSAIITFTIYADRLIMHIEIVADSSGVTVDASSNNRVTAYHSSTANITNEVSIRENSGSESTGEGEYNTADYIGFTSDEINGIGIVTNRTEQGGSPPSLQQRNYSQAIAMGWDGGTLGEGLNTFTTVFVFDSAQRALRINNII